MKKKILALALAATMMMGLSSTVFAATETEYTYTDEVSVSVSKSTTSAEGTTAPSEMLSFTVTEGTFTPYNSGDTADVPEIDDFTIATTDGAGSATITLPDADDFAALGTYTYIISETEGSQAGMTYDHTTYTMTISIILDADGNQIRVVSIVNNTTGQKVDTEDPDKSGFGFENTYTASSLSVQKIVKGNMGDTTKEFSFTVTFANKTEGQTWAEAIGHVDGQGDSSYNKTTNDDGSVTYTFTLSDQDTVEFTNIPSGLYYTVSEVADGYTQTVSGGSLTGTTSGSAVELVVTNTLDKEVPTGVNLDSLPYIMILALVLIGAAYVISRKRLTDR